MDPTWFRWAGTITAALVAVLKNAFPLYDHTELAIGLGEVVVVVVVVVLIMVVAVVVVVVVVVSVVKVVFMVVVVVVIFVVVVVVVLVVVVLVGIVNLTTEMIAAPTKIFSSDLS